LPAAASAATSTPGDAAPCYRVFHIEPCTIDAQGTGAPQGAHIPPTPAGSRGSKRRWTTENDPARAAVQVHPATTEPTQFLAFIRAAEPYYELFGGKEVRLLQNVDQPAQFIQIIDYEVNESLETNRQQLAGDPRLQAFLQGWRALFPGTVEVDVFREIDT